MGCFSKLAEIPGINKIFSEHIYPLLKKKFDLSQYIDLNQIVSFLDDFILVAKELWAGNFKVAYKLLKPHSFLLLAFAGIAAQLFLSKLKNGEFYQLIWMKLNSHLTCLACGIWIGLGMYFAFQCADLYKIGCSIKTVEKQINDPEFSKGFDFLEMQINKLRAIEQDIEQLKKTYENTNDYTKLFREIKAKHKLANDIFEAADKILRELKVKLSTQEEILKNTQSKAETAKNVSRILLGFSAAVWWFCPIFGAVAIAATAISTTWSYVLLDDIRNVHDMIKAKHDKLNGFETEMNEVMDKISREADLACENANNNDKKRDILIKIKNKPNN